MSRAFAFLSAMILALGFGCARKPQSPPETDPAEGFPPFVPPTEGPYYATTVGTKWVYQSSTGEVSTRLITKVENVGGELDVTVHQVEPDGRTEYRVTVRVSPRGLHIVDDAGIEWSPPLWELKLPHQEGGAWDVGVRVKYKSEPPATFEQLWQFTAYGPEEVTVPAGTFQAIRVVRAAQPMRSEQTNWYARGVGVVKAEYGIGPNIRPKRVTSVLKAFRPGNQ